MKPARSPQLTGCLPIRRHRSVTVAATSEPVDTVLTTSTSFMIGAGLKKCMPTTSRARDVTAAHSTTGRDDVVVARIAPGLQIASRFANRSEEHTSELQSRQYLVCRLLL